MTKQDAAKVPVVWAIVVPCAVVALVSLGIILARHISLSKIDNFQACKQAKGEVMESYPEQCSINGKTFVNDAQVTNNDDYIGLTEQEALDKAQQEGVAARVIERDGQPLPATMDYRIGRHNFSVKDGKVYEVYIEGEGEDSSLDE